jgi:rare lipoprotein A
LRADDSRRMIGRLNVYRRTSVSWYGPGLYGNKLSCGGRLTPSTLGVAHKTLPCGTRVTLRRGHRVVRVKVVDRGPYVGGREFDLTAATRAKLRFGGVGSLLVAG